MKQFFYKDDFYLIFFALNNANNNANNVFKYNYLHSIVE